MAVSRGEQSKTNTMVATLQNKVMAWKDTTVTLVKNPQFQTCTITTAGGTVTFGTLGGAFGLASGVVAGSAVGIVPALVTFGLSIPAGGVVGGIGGLLVGSVSGGTVGTIAGYGAYKYRVEIHNNLAVTKLRAIETAKKTKKRALALRDDAANKASFVVDLTKSKGSALKTKAFEVKDLTRRKAGELATFATTTRPGVMATSAMAGTAAGGVVGGSAGAVTGALLGVVPAIFTLGFSIPVGGGIGLCCGTAAGSTAGAIGGGALGFGGFKYRNEIAGTVDKAWTRVSTTTGQVKTKASERVSQVRMKAIDSVSHVKDSVKSLVGGSTGGSGA